MMKLSLTNKLAILAIVIAVVGIFVPLTLDSEEQIGQVQISADNNSVAVSGNSGNIVLEKSR